MNDISMKAREWINVTFQDGGYTKNGCDCLGLLIGILNVEDLLELYKNHHSNRNIINGEKIYMAMSKYYHRIDERSILVGDIIIFSMLARNPLHIGIISNVSPLTMIHAYNVVHRVTENLVDNYWIKRIKCFARISV